VQTHPAHEGDGTAGRRKHSTSLQDCFAVVNPKSRTAIIGRFEGNGIGHDDSCQKHWDFAHPREHGARNRTKQGTDYFLPSPLCRKCGRRLGNVPNGCGAAAADQTLGRGHGLRSIGLLPEPSALLASPATALGLPVGRENARFAAVQSYRVRSLILASRTRGDRKLITGHRQPFGRRAYRIAYGPRAGAPATQTPSAAWRAGTPPGRAAVGQKPRPHGLAGRSACPTRTLRHRFERGNQTVGVALPMEI